MSLKKAVEEGVTVLRWQSAMQLGVPVLDADHKRLVGLLNALHYMVIAGGDRDGMADMLEEFAEYANGHFAREESLMERARYPAIEAHRRSHREFSARLGDELRAFRQAPEAFDTDAFYDFVTDWLLHHVLGQDMKLRPFLECLSAEAHA